MRSTTKNHSKPRKEVIIRENSMLRAAGARMLFHVLVDLNNTKSPLPIVTTFSISQMVNATIHGHIISPLKSLDSILVDVIS